MLSPEMANSRRRTCAVLSKETLQDFIFEDLQDLLVRAAKRDDYETTVAAGLLSIMFDELKKKDIPSA